jgi:hypothetical protein
MTTWFHSTIIATSLAACVAVGFASASIYSGASDQAAPKTDRLPIVADADATYRTVETRMDGVSVLTRLPVTEVN